MRNQSLKWTGHRSATFSPAVTKLCQLLIWGKTAHASESIFPKKKKNQISFSNSVFRSCKYFESCSDIYSKRGIISRLFPWLSSGRERQRLFLVSVEYVSTLLACCAWDLRFVSSRTSSSNCTISSWAGIRPLMPTSLGIIVHKFISCSIILIDSLF